MRNANVAMLVYRVACFRFALHADGRTMVNQLQPRMIARPARMGTRYATIGPRKVSQDPPRPIMDNPIGSTQHDAESSANMAAPPSKIVGGARVSRIVESGIFAFIRSLCIL